ncbi:hypothetical protein PMAYCL1PPCAC_07059 [Pristionchus mayeri]|uniref:Uncharacterized protein n=1 Tax=Pristionchus mayeri TaxID=1317129 RepID=A0AAN4ZBD2_9BILA|nr:hypothetical protein PMAYCL1PPCAC_07059 [Pristionchus mayeri]
MALNTLVVTVHRARGLNLKGQTELNVSATLCLQGKGSIRSKCVTERVETTQDPEWNEGCEFKINEESNKLTVTVSHHTRMGGTDLIGKCEILMSEIADIDTPMWYRLRKKEKDEKNRGDILLHFKLSYVKPQLSVSNLSLNTIPKDSVLTKMKNKMKLGRKGRDKDSLSVFSAFAPSMHKMNRHETAETMNKTFHGETSSLRRSGSIRRPLDVSIPHPVAVSSPFQSPANQQDYIGGSNLNVSNISTAESFGNISQLQRQNSRRSFASSGFGSSKSKEGKKEEKNWSPSEWGDLASEVDRLRAELAVKDSRMKDMEEYLDTLLKKVMEHHPELLAAGPKTKNQLSHLSFNYR